MAMEAYGDDVLQRALMMRDQGVSIEEIAAELGIGVDELEMFFAEADAEG